MLPALALSVERVLMKSVKKIHKLVLKCDGMTQNKNVPQYLAEILVEKWNNEPKWNESRTAIYYPHELIKIFVV